MLSFNKCTEHQHNQDPYEGNIETLFLLPLRFFSSPPLTWKVYYITESQIAKWLPLKYSSPVVSLPFYLSPIHVHSCLAQSISWQEKQMTGPTKMAPSWWGLSGIQWEQEEILVGWTDYGGGRLVAVPWSIIQELADQQSWGLVLLHLRAFHIQLSPGIQSSQGEWREVPLLTELLG